MNANTCKSKLTSLFRFFCLLLCITGGIVEAKAQNPDCQFFFNFTSATNSNTYVNYPASGVTSANVCTNWVVSYVAYGFSGLTLTFQSAPTTSGSQTTPGTWGSYAGTTLTGYTNPMTSTTGAEARFSNVAVSTPFLRVALSGLTGSGRVWGTVYGYKAGYSAGVNSSGTCPNAVATDVLVSDGVNCTGNGDLTFVAPGTW